MQLPAFCGQSAAGASARNVPARRIVASRLEGFDQHCFPDDGRARPCKSVSWHGEDWHCRVVQMFWSIKLGTARPRALFKRLLWSIELGAPRADVGGPAVSRVRRTRRTFVPWPGYWWQSMFPENSTTSCALFRHDGWFSTGPLMTAGSYRSNLGRRILT